jgi:hypothetical protein
MRARAERGTDVVPDLFTHAIVVSRLPGVLLAAARANAARAIDTHGLCVVITGAVRLTRSLFH